MTQYFDLGNTSLVINTSLQSHDVLLFEVLH